MVRHWLLVFLGLWGLYVGLPWLAPLLMRAGAAGPARAIYLIYSTQCHQLPERSYFLFGSTTMPTLEQVKTAWQDTDNPLILRQFVGNSSLGWKVAWSDRMVSLYTSMFFAALAYIPLRRRLRPLPLWAFILAMLPLALDGATHFVSDLAGIGQGFRDSNLWLAALTNQALPATFYAGDALGSFNWWMRLATGVLMGVSLIWFAFPQMETLVAEAVEEIRVQRP